MYKLENVLLKQTVKQLQIKYSFAKIQNQSLHYMDGYQIPELYVLKNKETYLKYVEEVLDQKQQ